MLPVSENQVLPLAEGLGFTVVRFEDGDIRIDPPTPFLLVTLKQNGGPGPTPVDMTAFDGRPLLCGRARPLLPFIERHESRTFCTTTMHHWGIPLFRSHHDFRAVLAYR